MSDFKQQYKNPRPGFGHAGHGRVLRASKHVESRREVRTRAFDKNRKLQDVSISASPLEDTSIKDARMKKLLKWREERKRKKKMEDARKKPAFKVGVVHHSVYSPVTRSAATTVTNTTVGAKASKQTTQSSNNFPKGITKVTQKRLLSKATSKQQIVTKNIASTSTKYPSMNMKKLTSNNKKQKSFAPDNCEFKPPNGLLKMPLFGLVQVEQTPQEKGDFFIQDKSTECKTVDRNEQKDTSSQKLNEKIPNTNSTTTNFNVSASPKLLSNKQKSLQGLNKSICDDLNDVTPQLNEITTKLSLEEEIQDLIQDSFQNKSLSGNRQTSQPSQKNTPINASFGNVSCTEDLITFSPYLTLSRGKKNARKEQQQRLGIYPRLSSDEIPTKDTVMKNLNISVEEEERTAQYFKFLLNKETERLKELCRKWLDIKLEKDIPDDAMYEIHQAVGQTNLLINKKFERFRSLVEDCENGKGEKLVTCRDLQGFWDMTYMEVKNCDSRFEKLEQRQNSGWQEECIVTKPAIKKRMPIKKQIEPSKHQAKSSSSLRSLIMAARNKKMQGKTSNLMQDTNVKDVSIKYFTPSKNTRKSVNFDDSTDTQCNTRKSKSFEHTRKSTPVRRESFKSLVQEVQLSSNKRIKSPFVTIKVSQMGKTPEIQLDDTISYINSDQTPGKSILKKSEELVHKETHTKSAHKVNFDDQIVLNEVPLDEEEQTKLNLSLALKRIDSLDLDELSPEECFDAGKKLNFETDDSDHFDDMNEISTEIQRLDKEKPNKLSIQDTFDSNAHLLNTTFDKESSPNDARIISPKKKLKYQNQHKNMENLNISASPLETEIPSENVFINIIPATPLETATPSDTILNTIEMENHDLGIKILRNRTITTVNIPKNDRTSKSYCTPRKSVTKKENKDPVKLNRKSLLKLSEKDENKYKTPDRDSITEMRKTILTENIDKKRRSSRKSVAFNAETCLACAESKPVLPMTPHSKRNRSKTPSRQSRSKHACNEDLILWDTPKHIPNRVTRSHTKN
ncbi:Disks large-associated protein 5 [Camponotus floridanus]|uniref:Disks large-associated protein 5 n=1 Tax=Camponotus floridanus TaxID=104421 RepID=E1ZXV0_CAMFO|nr:uncharacterized protein LOC105255056 [Camponotus floridanus]EFN73981.1 Disks large-associated protein 5 [Camponotus floridanus]